MKKLTEEKVNKLIETIECGLVEGIGIPKPGKMCVMHAISLIIEGVPDQDNPKCVAPLIISFDIGLNDSNWSSNKARGKGMLREAIAKLGSTEINIDKWRKLVMDEIGKEILPNWIRYTAGARYRTGHFTYLQKIESLKMADELESGKRTLTSKSFGRKYYCNKLLTQVRLITALSSPVKFIYHLADFKTSKLKWDTLLTKLADISADALVKCKTEGSKFLYLLDK